MALGDDWWWQELLNVVILPYEQAHGLPPLEIYGERLDRWVEGHTRYRLTPEGKARWGQYAAAVATYADFIAFYHSVTGMDMADNFVHGEEAAGHLVLSDAQGLYISPALWTHGLNGLPGLLQQGGTASVLHAASCLVFKPLQDYHDPAAIGREHFIVPLLQHFSHKFAQIVEMIGQGMLHEEELLLKQVTLNVCDACRRALLWLAMHVQQNPALYLDEDGDAEDDWEDEVPPAEQFAL